MPSHSGIRFGCEVAPFGDVKKTIEYSLLVERSGFDVVTLPDHLFHPETIASPPWEVYTLLSAIATKTDRVRLGPGISDAIRRHPATIAHMISTLDHISNGRAMLSLGAGEAFNFTPIPDVEWSRPVSILREAIQVIRKLWSSSKDHPASFRGKYFSLTDAYHTLKPLQKAPPVYVGGYGPRMKKLIAELADGWIPWIESPETYAKGLQEIKSFAEDLGTSNRKLDAALIVFTSVNKDGSKARSVLRERARWALSVRTRLLENLGYHDLAKMSVDMWRAKFTTKEVRQVDALSLRIPDDVADEVTLAGTVDEVIGKIERYHNSGVRLIVIEPNVDDGEFERTVSIFQRSIIPYFREQKA